MLTRALPAVRQTRHESDNSEQYSTSTRRARPCGVEPHLRKLEHLIAASTKIGQYMSAVLPIAMRSKHLTETALTLNHEHFSGLGEALPQLQRLNKYKAPDLNPDCIDGALNQVPANLQVQSQDMAALVKEDKTPLAPLQYLKTEAERAPYALSICAGNRLVWTATQEPVAKGDYLVVWGPNQKLYAAKEKVPGRAREFRHSSFFAGAAVPFAGEFQTDEHGRMITLNNKSGHYRPEFGPWVSFLGFLRTQGIQVEQLQKTFVTKSKRQAFYLKWLQVNGSDTGQVERTVKQRQ